MPAKQTNKLLLVAELRNKWQFSTKKRWFLQGFCGLSFAYFRHLITDKIKLKTIWKKGLVGFSFPTLHWLSNYQRVIIGINWQANGLLKLYAIKHLSSLYLMQITKSLFISVNRLWLLDIWISMCTLFPCSFVPSLSSYKRKTTLVWWSSKEFRAE